MGSALAKGADGQIDQAGIVAGQVLIANTQPGRDARPETFDQDIAVLRKSFSDRDPVLMLHIEAEAALAAIKDRRQSGVIAVGRSEIARPVPLGRLDLDHVSPVSTEQHPTIGRCGALPEIEHAQATVRRIMRSSYLALKEDSP